MITLESKESCRVLKSQIIFVVLTNSTKNSPRDIKISKSHEINSLPNKWIIYGSAGVTEHSQNILWTNYHAISIILMMNTSQ